MARLVLIFLLFLSFSLSDELRENLKSFFEREGYVIKVEGDRVWVDVKNLREKEELIVLREGKEIIHPITKQSLGRELEKIGKVVVEEVKDKFSVGRLLEGKDVRPGDRVKLEIKSVCYEGSEEGYFLLSSILSKVERGKNCNYTVREFERGYGVEFKGSAIAFFEKPTVGIPRASLEDINILVKGKFVKQLPSLPISADVGDVVGDGRDYLVVLFSGKVEVYEIIRNDIVLKTAYSLPAGVPVSLVLASVGDEKKDYIIVNMISGTGANSVILRMVGGVLTPVLKDVPYIMGVLDKSRPKETFLGQRFDSKVKFGNVIRLSLEGNRLQERGLFLAPRGFRIDSAIYYGNYLIFVDSAGRLKVFEDDSEIYASEDSFDGSYAYVEIVEGDLKHRFVFYPKPALVKLMNFSLTLVPKNTGGSVLKILDVLKFTRGELVIVGEKKKRLVFSKTVRGSEFLEAIQAVVSTKDGRVFVLTGRVGTIPVQSKGDLYELEFRLL
ncbi:hypothetical protein [Thermocrinis sp.]